MQRLELLTGKASRQDLDVAQNQSNTRDDILDVIGVKLPFEAPFYLFFFINDLIDDNQEWVSFVGYQMKSPGPAFWGRLHKTGNQPIQMKGSCIYRTNIINQMVKHWKANGFQYGVGSVKDRSKERIDYYLGDNQVGFDEAEQIKTIASYFRGETNKLASSIPKTKANEWIKKMELMEANDPEDLIRFHSKIDRQGTEREGSRKKGIIYFIRHHDYERYKAFLALLEGRITENQFRTLYPWEYTLDMMEQILFDDLRKEREIGDSIESIKMDYPNEYKEYLNGLKKSIETYEKQLNRIDPDPFVGLIFEQIQNFFQKLEQRKIKILPKEPCPELRTCLKLDGTIDESIDTCEVYFYPSSPSTTDSSLM